MRMSEICDAGGDVHSLRRIHDAGVVTTVATPAHPPAPAAAFVLVTLAASPTWSRCSITSILFVGASACSNFLQSSPLRILCGVSKTAAFLMWAIAPASCGVSEFSVCVVVSWNQEEINF